MKRGWKELEFLREKVQLWTGTLYDRIETTLLVMWAPEMTAVAESLWTLILVRT